MNEKRTDFATILCWVALGIAGVAFAIFLVVAIINGVKKFKNYLDNKNDNPILQEQERYFNLLFLSRSRIIFKNWESVRWNWYL